MDVISNAFFSQAEVTQLDRWEYGPLELKIVPEPRERTHGVFGAHAIRWNSHQCAGYLRDPENLEFMQSAGLVTNKNPNVVIAPSWSGYSELLGMLGSLLPDSVLAHHGINRPESGFWLWPCTEDVAFRGRVYDETRSLRELNVLSDRHLRRLASVIPGAFDQWIWTKLVRHKRFNIHNYSRESSLRMLSGDVRFWMNRLYRVAIEIYESFPPTAHEEEHWLSLAEIQQRIDASLPENDRPRLQITRPRMGGSLWDPTEAGDRERVAGLLVDGAGTTDSLEPVIEVLLGSGAHEDFSEHYSWIKEDFERSFYSKRAKVEVSLHEFVDDCAVHDGCETPGYDDILFRDVMAFFDEKDRRIILALRQGKTKSDIAEELGHSGHASISRRVQKIERRMRKLLDE